jgi:ribosomal protein uL24
MSDSPHSPRRQRKANYEATTFQRRRLMAVPLSRELRRRFSRRSVPLRKGDTVRVMAGSYVGREERVAKVHRRTYSVTLDNVTLKTGEEKLKPLAIRTSHLVITRLNLADAWRRRALAVREEDVTPEERGETPAVAEGEDVTPEPVTAPSAPSTSKDPEDDEEEDAEDVAPPLKAPARRKSAPPAKKEDEA